MLAGSMHDLLVRSRMQEDGLDYREDAFDLDVLVQEIEAIENSFH